MWSTGRPKACIEACDTCAAIPNRGLPTPGCTIQNGEESSEHAINTRAGGVSLSLSTVSVLLTVPAVLQIVYTVTVQQARRRHGLEFGINQSSQMKVISNKVPTTKN